MSTFRNLRLPQEIYDIIEIRCREQDTIFEIDDFSTTGSNEGRSGGFTWTDSEEGHTFWDNILGDTEDIEAGINEFFKLYPERIKNVQLISEEPRIYKANYKNRKYEITIKEIKDE